MSIPNHVMALASHKGAAIVHAGGRMIPVKIVNIESSGGPSVGFETRFECLVVDPSSVSTVELTKAAKAAVNNVYGAQIFGDVCRSSEQAYHRAYKRFRIDHVIFNGPATIVFWENGDKTIVVSRDGEMYDKETDLTLCFTLRQLGIAKIIFNNPTTTATWEDGTETIVHCQHGDVWSKETGLFTVIAKKALGNKGNFNDVFKKHIPEY